MKQKLTDRQADVLGYIKRFVAKFGYAPSMRTIGDRFDIAVNGVAGHLRALESKGYIKRTNGIARAMAMVVLD